jgi:riboflavin synthase alpha subunit
MEEKIVKATDNPTLTNQLVAEALKPVEEEVVAQVNLGTNLVVHLPGGVKTFSGEMLQEAEVRELTGKDEEAIARTVNPSKIYTTVLQRGVVSLNGMQVTPDTLSDMLVGDREALLLGIYRATYGNTAELYGQCRACGEVEDVDVDILGDIKIKALLDPFNDRTFIVKGRNKEFLVTLPTGVTEQKLLDSNGNASEKISILLEQTVLKIDGVDVFSRTQVQDLGMADRKTIIEEIGKRAPGPVFDDIKMECPSCGGDLLVPVSIGAIFRF